MPQVTPHKGNSHLIRVTPHKGNSHLIIVQFYLFRFFLNRVYSRSHLGIITIIRTFLKSGFTLALIRVQHPLFEFLSVGYNSYYLDFSHMSFTPLFGFLSESSFSPALIRVKAEQVALLPSSKK